MWDRRLVLKQEPGEEERFRRDVLRRWLRGESEEETIKALVKGGVPEAEARSIFREVVEKRIRASRWKACKKMMAGFLLIAVSLALAFWVWKVGDHVTIRASVALALLAGIGGWLLLNGLIGLLFAAPEAGRRK